MRTSNYLGIPNLGLNVLSVGMSVFLILLGIKALRTSDLDVKVANASFVTTESAKKLEELAIELERQTLLIQQKDEAYRELKAVYEQSLKGNKGYGKLQQAIETIEELPTAEHLESIQTQISITEELLTEITQE